MDQGSLKSWDKAGLSEGIQYTSSYRERSEFPGCRDTTRDRSKPYAAPVPTPQPSSHPLFVPVPKGFGFFLSPQLPFSLSSEGGLEQDLNCLGTDERDAM